MKSLLILIFTFQVLASDAFSLGSLSKVAVIKDSTVVTDTVKNPDGLKSISSLEAPDMSEIFSGYKIFWAIVFILAGYIILRFITGFLNTWAERSTRYRISIKSTVPIIKILGWFFIVFVVIAGIFQPPAATILAFSASIGVAIGFASQDVLKNIFAGIVILLDKPFASGDKIEVGSYYGEVVEIGLRSTRIVTPDDSLVTLPNNEIMNGAVSNSNSGQTNCQVVAEIYLPIDIDTVMVRELATEIASVSKYVYLEKPIVVLFFNEVKDRKSYMKMRLKAYVSDIRDEFRFKSEMTEMTVKKLVELEILKP